MNLEADQLWGKVQDYRQVLETELQQTIMKMEAEANPALHSLLEMQCKTLEMALYLLRQKVEI